MATLDNYELLRDLGKGAFSTVKLAKNKDTDKLVALKIIKDDAFENSSTMKAFTNEVDIMKDISHPNIINMLSSTDSGSLTDQNGKTKDNVIYLTLELAQGGELFDFIAQTGHFSEPIARFYFHQIVDAFEYLHGKGISHRDMKPDNIMLDEDFNLKIADFGFSSRAATNLSFKGTRSYMAPEILIGAKYYGHMVDIFAAGIILFIMVAQLPPFQMAHPKDGWYKFVCSNRMDKFWHFHNENQDGSDFFSKSFIDLMNWIFNFDHTARPSLAEIKEHPWYNGPTATAEEVKEEFTQRKQMLEGLSSDPVPQTSMSDAEYNAHSVTRSVTGEVEENSGTLTLTRQEAVYVPGISNYTKFYSTSTVDDLFACAASYAKELSPKYEFSASEYSVTMTIEVTKPGDGEEAKTKDEVVVRIDIQKYDDTKHIIEATKIEGDRFYFNDQFKRIKTYFAGHVNASA